jgi:alpha-L-rhamnosidase
MIKSGENTIKAVVGQGYYSGFAGYNRFAHVYGEQNSFIGRIEIEYTDGTSNAIVTDEEWEIAECEPVIFADYLQGEYYDARLENAGIPWDKCSIVSDPSIPVPTNGVLDNLEFSMDEQTCRGAHEVMRLNGKYLGESRNGHKIYDMGVNMVGTVKIRLRGKYGESVKVRYGEMLKKNGELYVANLRSAANTDVYILKGARDGETFFPNLTAHGFRYVEITGHGENLNDTHIEIESVDGIVISNTDRVTGGFECSDELINKLYSNIVWGQRGNYLLVPTDCPQRNERMGWTGDAQVFARTAAYNMDVYDFTRKWLRDLREAQLMYNKNGAVPDTAPLCGDNRPMGGCGGWGDAAVIVPWEMYMAYGDISVLEENYDMMKSWVDYQNSAERRNNGLRVVNGIEMYDCSDFSEEGYIQIQQSRGDHLTFDESTPFILSATAYAAYSAELLAKTAELLGKIDDSKKYNELHNKIKKAFNDAWVEPDGTLAYWGEMSKSEINKTYYSESGDNRPSQTAYALAIDFGLIDTKKYPHAAECFKKTVDDRGGKLSTGFLGISHLLPALMKCGYKETAFRLLENKENPGWLYSVINGATTIWERWDSYIAETDTFGNVSMNSFNHYAYGAVGEWMFASILGIEPVEPGYKKFRLCPNYGGKLTYAKGFHETPYGIIKSEWELNNGNFVYRCTVPDGTEAVVIMPDGKKKDVGAGEYEFKSTI